MLLHPVYRRRRSVPLPTPPSPLTLRGTPGTPLVGPPTTQLGRPLWFPAGVGPTTLVSSKSTLHQTTLVLTIPPPQIVSSKESTGPQVFQHPSGSTLLWHLLKSKRRKSILNLLRTLHVCTFFLRGDPHFLSCCFLIVLKPYCVSSD